MNTRHCYFLFIISVTFTLALHPTAEIKQIENVTESSSPKKALTEAPALFPFEQAVALTILSQLALRGDEKVLAFVDQASVDPESYDIVFGIVRSITAEGFQDDVAPLIAALKPGGTLHLLVATMSSPLQNLAKDPEYQALSNMFPEYSLDDLFPYITRSQSSQWLSNTGLTSVISRCVITPNRFDTSAGIEAFLTTLSSRSTLESAVKAQIIKKYSALLARKHKAPDAPSINLSSPLIHLMGIKKLTLDHE